MNIVIINCFDTWEQRVELLYKVLSSDGHKVRVLMSDFRHIEKDYRTDKKKDYKFFHADEYRKNMSVDRLRSHIRLSANIFSFLGRHSSNIDLLWVLAPPNSFVKDAAKFKTRNPRIKLVIDLIDLWPETMPVGKIKPLLVPWKMLRDRNLKYADLIATECNLYQKVLKKQLQGKRVETLYLAREDKGYEPNLHLPDDKISLCYLGSINNIIDIDAIGNVIRECGKVRPVILHIIGDGEKKGELVRKAGLAGAHIIDHGTVYDRKAKQEVFNSSHYGLNIMKDLVCVGLTMKSIDYFEFGLPIINNIKGDTWEAIEKYECGVNMKSQVLDIPIQSEKYQRQRSNSRYMFTHYLTDIIFEQTVINKCI